MNEPNNGGKLDFFCFRFRFRPDHNNAIGYTNYDDVNDYGINFFSSFVCFSGS